MLFRAYYATVYGRMMRTANGIPTNAVFGFVTMFQKALEQIEPDGVLVAWECRQADLQARGIPGIQGHAQSAGSRADRAVSHRPRVSRCLRRKAL